MVVGEKRPSRLWSGWRNVGVVLELDDRFAGLSPEFDEARVRRLEALVASSRLVVG